MQNKKTKNQLQKDLRRLHERTGAAVILLAILASTVAVSQEVRRVVGSLALRPVYAAIEHSNKGNEVAERAIRLERAMPANSIGGQ